MKPRRIREALRSPGFLATSLCLCLILGFFTGALRVRSRSAEVTVVARGSQEEVRRVSAERVNINTADAELLQTLPGIGQTLAARIIAYREENGDFRYLYELTNVKGIGSSTFEALQDLITLDTEEQNHE